MDKKKIATVMCLMCLLWLIPLLRAETSLDQVFAKMDETSKTFRSVECGLERTKVTVLVNDKDVATGKLYYTRSGKEPRLRVEIMKPGDQILLIANGKAQLYIPKINQVQEYSLGGQSKVMEQFMAIGFGQSSADLKKNYQVTYAGEETIDGKKAAMLDLVPKTPVGGLKTVRIWLDEQKGIAVQVKATETGGDYTIFKYSNIKLNPAISDTTFELKLPKDVHVNKLS